MVLTGIKPMSYTPMGTPCMLHNLSISISKLQCRNCYTSKLRLCFKVRVMENRF